MTKLPIAALDGAQSAFYATAATVTPVLLLAYLVQLAALAKQIAAWFETLEHQATEGARGALKSAEGSEPDAAERKFVQTSVPIIARELLRIFRNRVIVPLLLVAVILPTAAEVCAFAALARDAPSDVLLVIVWIGLVVSMVMALSPAVYAVALLYRSSVLDPIRTSIEEMLTRLAQKHGPRLGAILRERAASDTARTDHDVPDDNS
ncbi:MAG TPA: hypothetical protein VFF79_15180 [Conexibacter sp.]|jgi:hypothetical protein|nr:hypothetical protein [Conexibacter sp.]